MRTVHHQLIGPMLGAILLLGCGGGAPTGGEGTAGSSTDSSTGTGATVDTTTTDALISADSSSGDPPCVPISCADEGLDCGLVFDGCAGELDCGLCEASEVCGGAGPDNVCGVACTPVAAIFFDLGGTLVEPVGGGLFAELPGAATLLTDLQALSIPIGLITNTLPGSTEDDLRDILVNPDLLDEFDVVLLSSQATSLPKPDPGIFNEAYALLRSPPPIEEVVFVTEELDHIANVEVAPTQGAKAAGMLGVHLSEGAPSPLTDYTFAPDDLNAIAQIAATEWLPCATKTR